MKNGKARQQTRGQKVLVTLLLILFICCLGISIIPHNHVSQFASVVKQKGRLKSIDTALELFKAKCGEYPPSDSMDDTGVDYCGAMKLCEAVMGQDLMGYHTDSLFRSDGTDRNGNVLYPPPTDGYDTTDIEKRQGPYLPLEYVNAYSLADLYGEGNTGPFDPNHFVLCDVFKTIKHCRTGKRVGMPILYYKADMTKTAHDVNDPNNPQNIYNYKDNHALLALGIPGKPGLKHPLYEDPKILYEIAWNNRANGPSRPYNPDTFILLSAGQDGLYGTKDDIANFDFRWKRK